MIMMIPGMNELQVVRNTIDSCDSTHPTFDFMDPEQASYVCVFANSGKGSFSQTDRNFAFTHPTTTRVPVNGLQRGGFTQQEGVARVDENCLVCVPV